MGVEEKIVKVSEAPHYLKMLVYGEPGVGKTVFSSTAPKPLIIDAEGGTLSIAKKKDVFTYRIDDFSELSEIFVYLRKNEHKFETVVLDTITEIQKRSMDKILKEAIALDPNRDPDVAILRDWGKNTEQVRKVIRAFRDLEMHVIFIALADSVRDETDGSLKVQPSLTPRLVNDICAYVDVVGYLFVQEKEEGKGKKKLLRRMLFHPIGKYVAKDRSGKLPLVLDEPSFPKILKIVLGGEESENKG